MKNETVEKDYSLKTNVFNTICMLLYINHMAWPKCLLFFLLKQYDCLKIPKTKKVQVFAVVGKRELCEQGYGFEVINKKYSIPACTVKRDMIDWCLPGHT